MLNKTQNLVMNHSTSHSSTSSTRTFLQHKKWICDSGTSEDVNALREFIDQESEFMTAASETIAGVLKDETKGEREPS